MIYSLMMRKVTLIAINILLSVTTMPMFAQEVKKDTLTDLQKSEIMKSIVLMFTTHDSGKKDQGKEQQRQDSIQKVVETKYKPGTSSADFRFKDIHGNVFSLKDFKGKYVYIDVWATWCGPCFKEIPFLQQLEEKMKGKNMAFVSISWDRNRGEWVKALEEKKLGGVQLHFGGDETFFKEYGIMFIPRFILLDKKGKVVNAYMTRPSDPETEEVFKRLKGL